MKHIIHCGKCHSGDLEQSDFVDVGGRSIYYFHCDKCNSETVIEMEYHETY